MSKNFVASYSGGKDSILAIYRAIKQGYNPVALFTTYNTDLNRSWFHGIPEDVLQSVSDSLDIPIWVVKTTGELYAQNLEKTLIRAKELGAEVCVFGDIDIEDHRQWCGERCRNAGIEPFSPLWRESRKQLVYEFIDSGFIANITVIDTARMDASFLGQTLTTETVNRIEAQGADICGENGEYHTFVSNGPIFKRPVDFSFGEKLVKDGYAIMPVQHADFS